MIKILIASSIRQKKAILEQFLLSIYDLNLNGLNIDYAFVDDNDDKSASNLIRNFRPLHSRKWIFDNDSDKQPYMCDDDIHHWNTLLVSRVAANKDVLIKHAIREQYDYLLLVDSDLLLHPHTLLHLISCQRDIVSEVFWTRWPGIQELPNVWLRDEYKLYKTEHGEKIDNNEKNLRSNNFLNQLRQPGLYKVGGLGACTLISGKALAAGVCFKEIYNLSFQGEDRHFCVRAIALGFELFVDTCYPCYHVYRDSDLEGVPAFLRSVSDYSSNHLNLMCPDKITDSQK